MRRNYSLCVAPQDDQVTVTVKRIAGGVFSNWANDHLRPGDAIDVMPPHGSFSWDFEPNAANHYVGFSGGSGITPVMLLRHRPADRARQPVHALRQSRQPVGDLLPRGAGELKNAFMERLEVHHFLAEEAEDIDLFNGMLDRAKCDEILDHLVDPAQGPPSSSAVPSR